MPVSYTHLDVYKRQTYTNSIWDKKQRENPMENRKIFYNTHQAIISLEVFDKVQEIRQQQHRRSATGKSNMFSGLVFCNDCKQKLYYSTTSYFCLLYTSASSGVGTHRICLLFCKEIPVVPRRFSQV